LSRWHDDLAPAVRLWAVDWQLLDPKETARMLTNPADFTQDLQVLQRRYHELLTAPWLQELQRFPDRKLVDQQIGFNRAYHKELTEQIELDRVRKDELREALEETDQLFRIWDALRDAQTDHYMITYRRQALAQLRELMGLEAFVGGQMPPALPIWRFPQE
jgi:hypothetical protein